MACMDFKITVAKEGTLEADMCLKLVADQWPFTVFLITGLSCVLYLLLVNSFILGVVQQRLFLPSLLFPSSLPLPEPSSSSQLLYLQG